MRLTELMPRTFNTVFHGLTLPVLPDEQFLAADPDGSVWAFIGESAPTPTLGWRPAQGAARLVGRVDLEGLDWKKSLVEVDPLVE